MSWRPSSKIAILNSFSEASLRASNLDLLTKVLPNFSNNCILECLFNKDEQNFSPILVRTDKEHANSLRTVERTLFNASENILIEEFKI